MRIIIVFVLTLCTYSLKYFNWQQKHSATSSCCISKNGTICGKYFKDCCRSQCQPGIFGSQWCKQGDQYQPQCQSCADVCKKRNGISCDVTISTGQISCCQKQNCIIQNSNMQIAGDLTGKIVNQVTDKKHHSHMQEFQKYFKNKFYGEILDQNINKGKCKQDTQIQLGKCYKDSFASLLYAALMGD